MTFFNSIRFFFLSDENENSPLFHMALAELNRTLRSSSYQAPPTIPTEVTRSARVLGISPYAPLTEIQKTYRKLMKQYHPDHFLDDEVKEKATRLIVHFQEAYHCLVDYREKKSHRYQDHTP